jgi:hypothetical protein
MLHLRRGRREGSLISQRTKAALRPRSARRAVKNPRLAEAQSKGVASIKAEAEFRRTSSRSFISLGDTSAGEARNSTPAGGDRERRRWSATTVLRCNAGWRPCCACVLMAELRCRGFRAAHLSPLSAMEAGAWNHRLTPFSKWDRELNARCDAGPGRFNHLIKFR